MRFLVRICGAVLVLLLAMQALHGDAAAGTLSRKIVLETRTDNTATLTVELERSASLVLYYDNQIGMEVDNLGSYWFTVESKTATNVHVFELEELHPGETYVFRIEHTFPARRVDPARQWRISGNKPETIVVYGQNSTKS